MQLPVSSSESELEERIIQHLAAAAAMGRAHHFSRRESQRNRSSTQNRPQFLVFSTHPNGASATSAGSPQREGGGFPPAVMIAGPNSPYITVEDSEQLIPRISTSQANQHLTTGSGSNSSATSASQHGRSSSNRYFLWIISNEFLHSREIKLEGCVLVGLRHRLLQVIKIELDRRISRRSPKLLNPVLVHCQQGTWKSFALLR